MKKKEIVEQIIIALNWAKENWKMLPCCNQMEIARALKKDIWYESNKLTSNALMRFPKDELLNVLHDVVEAIY